jgi:hypothetical protein
LSLLLFFLIRDPKPRSIQRNYNCIYNHPSPVPDASGPRIGEIAAQTETDTGIA